MGQVKAVMAFRTYEEFWAWCNNQCPDRAVGCANKCIVRKMLGIPPFGKTYEGKLHGPVKVVG